MKKSDKNKNTYKRKKEHSTLTSIIIPSNITSIVDNAFYQYSFLQAITLPPNITSLGDRAFFGCSLLRSIKLPSTITSLGDGVFCRCSSLHSITLPSSIKSLGNGVFYGCSSLESITLPPTIISLGYGVFYECSSLKSINIPWSSASNTNSKSGSLLIHALHEMKPCNIKSWSRTRNEDGRSTLCTVVTTSMKWIYIKKIFDANMPAVYENDAWTGLSPFMLAAVGVNSDLESIYRLCRENPAAMSL